MKSTIFAINNELKQHEDLSPTLFIIIIVEFILATEPRFPKVRIDCNKQQPVDILTADLMICAPSK